MSSETTRTETSGLESQRSGLEVAVVTRHEFGTLAAANGIDLRPDLDVVMTIASGFVALIDLAEAQSLVVLGLDGFHLDGAVVVPSMDHIADFSAIDGEWTLRVKASADAARQVTQQWGPMPDLIEITLDGLDG